MGDRELRVENERPLWSQGNPDELHRMVLNLLDNAVRHTPPGSTVELRLRAEDGEAVVEVADDGPGIAAELRAQVFDRFVRGDGPADTATGPGSGLGLAIVQAVAASHGGAAEAAESIAGGRSSGSGCRSPARPAAPRRGFRPPLAARPIFFRGRDTGSAGFSPTAPGGPFFWPRPSDVANPPAD